MMRQSRDDENIVTDGNGTRVTRRGMLRTTGVSIGMAGISGLAVAEKHPDENRGTEQAGIQNAVDRLLQNGRVEQANKLLKKHDIEHATTKRTMEHSPEGPSTQDEWGKSESEWIRSTWVEDESNDRYGSYLWWHLKGGGCACDGAGPNDGVGLTLNPDNWNIDTGNRYSDEHTTLEDRDAEGRLWEYNDPSSDSAFKRDDSKGIVKMSAYRTEFDAPATIYGTYVHTWNPFGVPGNASFSLAVGPIGVSTGFNTHSWKRRIDHVVHLDGTIEEHRS